MFYEIKIVRKGVKPAPWRRAIVPSYITFAQLAYVLETILEFDTSDKYEFDFFRKYRISEITDSSVLRDTHYYTYMYAPDIYTRDIVYGERTFTFRILNSDMPEYTITVGIRYKTLVMSEYEYSFPYIKKQIGYEGINFQKDPNLINDFLSKKLRITEKEPDYYGILQIEKVCMKENFLYVSSDAESRHDRTKYSIKSSGAGFAEEFKKLMKKKNNPSNITVCKLLEKFSDGNLIDLAAKENYIFKSAEHDEMAEELSRYILKPEVMKERLLYLNHEEFEAFEEACEIDLFDFSADSENILDKAVEIGYLCPFTNGQAVIPEEVADVFSGLKSSGYPEYHLKAEWLKKCFEYAALVYGVTTLETIYRLFSKNIYFDADYDEFTKLLNSFPDSVNQCVVQGNKAVSKHCLADDLYKHIENDHSLKKYYIPSYSEIVIMAENGWPADLIVYNKIRDYIRAEFTPDEDELPYIMIQINHMLSLAAAETSVVSAIEETFGINITGKKLFGFLKLLRDASPQTRNMFYKGFTFNDLLNIKTDGNIVSDGLEYVSEEKANRELYEFLNSASGKSGSSGTVRKNPEDRIKPNSPCPCGSGKKYKKCCGMK